MSESELIPLTPVSNKDSDSTGLQEVADYLSENFGGTRSDNGVVFTPPAYTRIKVVTPMQTVKNVDCPAIDDPKIITASRYFVGKNITDPHGYVWISLTPFDGITMRYCVGFIGSGVPTVFIFVFASIGTAANRIRSLKANNYSPLNLSLLPLGLP